jgi:protein disulfide-isomerase A6
MKPAWDQLGDDYADSTSVIIGDVDCTIEKTLCGNYGVRGYPTIKYFTGSTDALGDKYEGGRDYESLKTFVEENLGPSCALDARELCSEEQLAAIDAALALTPEELQANLDQAIEAIADAEQDYKDTVASLQAQYEQAGKDKDAIIASYGPDLKTWRMVSAGKKAAAAASAKDEL